MRLRTGHASQMIVSMIHTVSDHNGHRMPGKKLINLLAEAARSYKRKQKAGCH